MTGAVTNVGNLTACGTSSSQYMSFTLDGTDYNFVPPVDSFESSTTMDSLGTEWSTYILATRQSGAQVTHAIDLAFKHASQVNGTYMADIAVSYPTQQLLMSSSPTISVVVSNFADAAFEYYEGTFSGTFQANGSTHTITSGTFRVRRNF
jgi:hypothetical protein